MSQQRTAIAVLLASIVVLLALNIDDRDALAAGDLPEVPRVTDRLPEIGGCSCQRLQDLQRATRETKLLSRVELLTITRFRPVD